MTPNKPITVFEAALPLLTMLLCLVGGNFLVPTLNMIVHTLKIHSQ